MASDNLQIIFFHIQYYAEIRLLFIFYLKNKSTYEVYPHCTQHSLHNKLHLRPNICSSMVNLDYGHSNINIKTVKNVDF